MNSFQNYLIVSLFLLNTFFIQVSDSNLSLTISVFSLIVIVLLLFKQVPINILDNNNHLSDDEALITPPQSINFSQKEEFQIEAILQLIQSIMKFDGFFYFNKTDSATLKYQFGEAKYASLQTVAEYISDGTYPGEFLKQRQSYFSNDFDQSTLSYYSSSSKTRKEIFAYPFIKNDIFYGVFVFDSCDKGTFNEEVISILSNIINLFTLSPIPKTSLSTTETTNKISKQLYELSNSVYSEQHFFELLKHVLPQLFVAKNFFIVKQVEANKAEIVSILGSVEGHNEKSVFSINEGLIGWALVNKKFVHVDKIVREEQYTIRFSENERRPVQTSSLIFQPLELQTMYGVGFESESNDAFSSDDINQLKGLTKLLSELLQHSIERQKLISNALFDIHDNVFSFNYFRHFYQNIENLFKRHDVNYSVLILELDFKNYLHDKQKEIVVKYVISELNRIARSSDSLFKYNERCLLLFLAFTDENQTEEISKRIITKINSSRILIENNYKEPKLAIQKFSNVSLDRIENFLLQEQLKNS